MASTRRNNPRKSRQTVAARSSEIVNSVLGLAEDALVEALTPTRTVVEFNEETGELKRNEEGEYIVKHIGADYVTARWLIDRCYPSGKTLVPIMFKDKIDTIDDVIAIAKVAVERVLKQEMSILEAEDLIGLLTKYATLRSFERINELKLLLKEVENSNGNNAAMISEKLMPQWGNLAEKAAANKTPAE